MAIEGEISEGDSQKWPRELPQNCPKNCPEKETKREVCFPKGTKKARTSLAKPKSPRLNLSLWKIPLHLLLQKDSPAETVNQSTAIQMTLQTYVFL